MSAKFEEIWIASATLQGLLWELKQHNGENLDRLRPEISDLLSKIAAVTEIQPDAVPQSVSEPVTVTVPDEAPIEMETETETETCLISDSDNNDEPEVVSSDDQETGVETNDAETTLTEPENETCDKNIDPDPQPARPEIISVDEKLSRKVSGDIRKAFSLNDKFLYRRELFGNSAQQYDAALDLISEMEGYEDAETYFLDNYGWNKEDVHVKNFMKILYNHFKSDQ